MHYRRANIPNATYFFTVNLAERQQSLLVEHIDLLRFVIRTVKQRHPFHIEAMVVLPDHLHALWRLPEGNADFATRWSLIKSGFSRGLAKTERINASRAAKRERGIWQRRYWEHLIRDDEDFMRHVDYIHYNPVKHAHTGSAAEWPYSSIHAYIRNRILTADWGRGMDLNGSYGERMV